MSRLWHFLLFPDKTNKVLMSIAIVPSTDHSIILNMF